MNQQPARIIKRDGPVPLYYQLKQILLEQIESDTLGPDEALPSEKELQDIYGVSLTTVRRAVNDLAAAGYLVRHSGRGTFVLQRKVLHTGDKIGGFVDDLLEQGFEVTSEVLEYEEQPVPFNVAQKMNVHRDQVLLFRKTLVIANEEPIALGFAYHNLEKSIQPTVEELKNATFLSLLREKYGVAFHHAERTTEAVAASPDEAALLGVEPGAPLLHVELLIRDEEGKAIYLVRSLYRGDRYKYCQTIDT